MSLGSNSKESTPPAWSDRRLIRQCLKGDDEAWSALIDRYSRLVFAICSRYAGDRDEAADLFQQVWIEVLEELPNLRQEKALRSWLATLAAHHCYRWKQKVRRRSELAPAAPLGDQDNLDDPAPPPPEAVEELERDQLVREAVAELPPRCREMLQLLFFAEPALPYSEVADRLGLAVGSIGLTRRRCLTRLEKLLAHRGIG